MGIQDRGWVQANAGGDVAEQTEGVFDLCYRIVVVPCESLPLHLIAPLDSFKFGWITESNALGAGGENAGSGGPIWTWFR